LPSGAAPRYRSRRVLNVDDPVSEREQARIAGDDERGGGAAASKAYREGASRRARKAGLPQEPAARISTASARQMIARLRAAQRSDALRRPIRALQRADAA
jgi:hypothetical protein